MWHRMYVQGAHFCCHQSDRSLALHAMFDYGVALRSDEGHDSIDVGILKQIVMVDYSDLKPILMKV